MHFQVQGNFSPETITYAGGSGAQYKLAGYSMVDNLANPATDTEAGIMLSWFAFGIGTSVKPTDTIRVGMMHDNLGSDEWSGDYGYYARLAHGVDGVAVAYALSDILPQGNGVVDMIFFDITGANPGDVFYLHGYRAAVGDQPASGQNAYIGNVTWDILPIPEPATLILLGMGGLACLRKRK